VHQFIPSATFTYDGAAYKTNRIGFRDRDFSLKKPAGTLRIAMLGDSFIEGLGEKQDLAIPKQLERLLSDEFHQPVDVMNAGVRGGSPATYQWWLRFLSDYSLDTVVVCVFDNDMDDDACALLTKAFYRAQAWYDVPSIYHRSNIFSYLQGELAAVAFKMKRKSLSMDIFNEPDFGRAKRRTDGDQNAVGYNSYGFFDAPEKWAREWQRTERNLNTIADLSKQQGIPLVIVHIPTNMVFPEHPGASTVPLKREYFAEWLKAWAAGQHVRFFDLSTPLSAWYRDPKKQSLYQNTYYHFNEQGLRLAAEWLKPTIVDVLREKTENII
jgi:lysophospholipase L1-like esterase